MQKSLDGGKLLTDLLNSAKYLKSHTLSNGKLGATGFCYSGGVINFLAVEMGGDLNAGAPFYGAAPKSENVLKIRSAIMAHYVGDDARVNATRPGYEAALKANNATLEIHTYADTKHAFHNSSTTRYNEAAAKLAWKRTVAHSKKHLA
jgi:carboxymethylenebutenolidase